MRLFAILPLSLLIACGDDGGSAIDAKPIDAKPIDAPIDGVIVDAPIDGPMIDAMQTVLTVACGSEVETITAEPGMFVPMSVTIQQDDVVKFDMSTVSATGHNVVPLTTQPTDPGIQVGYDEVKCLKFTATGTFNFKCNPHGFTGSVVVQ